MDASLNSRDETASGIDRGHYGGGVSPLWRSAALIGGVLLLPRPLRLLVARLAVTGVLGVVVARSYLATRQLAPGEDAAQQPSSALDEDERAS